jgi:DNA polymerase-3 subunit epsilon
MIWFKRKTYPKFWQEYLAHFTASKKPDLQSVRFVVFDTETTGLNPKEDRVLSIGCVGIKAARIKVADQLECYLKQEYFNPDTVKIHGLLKDGNKIKMDEEEAVMKFLDYIKDAVLVAHHAAFDIAMINYALKRMNLPKLKNKVLDTGHLFRKTRIDTSKAHFSLDNLSKRFNIPLHDRHTASGDAYITAILFLKLLAHFNRNGNLKLSDLLRPSHRVGLI